jgi:hypothetical protein
VVAVSNSTVQTILHDVDQRINDRKSTIIYFSGLMVFLGLLGAFMGLMKTVHSVGDLIGSMDVSGTAGTDSFGKLIEGMKGPLNGMSVGFSSSLFGLMTSMVLGALERCMTSAMKTLRNEFEHWLSNLAALENPHGENAHRAETDFSGVIRALEIGGKQLRDLREAVLGGARNTEATQVAMTDMAQAMTQLSQSVETVSDPTPLLEPIARVVAELARNQNAMAGQFHTLFDMAERDRTIIRQMLEGMNAAVDRQTGWDGEQLHHQLERMVALQSELLDKEPVVVSMATGAASASAPQPGLFARLITRNGDRSAPDSARERRKLRAEVRRVMLNQRRFVKGMEKSLGDSVREMEAGRKGDQELLARMIAQNDGNQARLMALLDRVQALDEALSGSSDDIHLLTGLHGARLEMDVLRKRMNLLQETGTPDKATHLAKPQTDFPATGTGNG